MNIALCYELDDKDFSKIAAAAAPWTVVRSSQQRIAEDIRTADVFCGHAKVPMPWEQVAAEGRLRWIQSSAAGLDHCLTPPVVCSPIQVSSASGLFRDQVAEQTMALLYGLVRRLPAFFRAAAERSYVRQPTDDLHGKRIGIVGFGGNGQRIAELLAPVGNPMRATDLFPEAWRAAAPLPEAVRLDPAAALPELLAASDIVILTVPMTPATQGLIGVAELQRMPPQSYLINVARGPVVQEAALVAALDDGRLAGAGLDVAETEPLPPTSALWKQPGVIITPHVGAQSHRRGSQVTELFLENLARFRDGRRLKNHVDKTLGFPVPEARL